jgi:hypothetical protein
MVLENHALLRIGDTLHGEVQVLASEPKLGLATEFLHLDSRGCPPGLQIFKKIPNLPRSQEGRASRKAVHMLASH